MTQARLIICPKSPLDSPTKTTDIKQTLTDIGLITDEFKPGTYYAGDNFISLITFLGCSPNIQLTPEDGDHFCSVNISEVTSLSQLLGYCKSISPKCPHCKANIKNWKDTALYQLASNLCQCEQCGISSPLSDLKWRQEGGYGRVAISIANIHSHEAVPAEKIFQNLKDTTGFEWTYFYANNEIQNEHS
jgi:hypothetical protein